jgi:hypothetical protein
MKRPVSRLLISTFLSPILDWTVAIVRLAIIPERERDEAPLIKCVETIFVEIKCGVERRKRPVPP